MPSLKSLALLLVLCACKSASQPVPIAETEDGQLRTCMQASTQSRLCLPAQ